MSLAKQVSFLAAFRCVALIHGQGSADTEITYADHIAPVIYENCATCHRPEGVGPFSLLTYEETRRRARQISEVTRSRFMPPWKPDQGHGPKFIGERRLTDDQIELLNRWANEGTASGDLSKVPERPEFANDWQLGEPDLVLELPEAYILQAEGEDVYRNFVIPLPLDSFRFVRAMEFRPRSQLNIHHAVLQVDKTQSSRERDELDPGPGFEGMGLGSAAPPEGQLVGWTPGQQPYESFPGTAWKLEPGDSVVLQLHMLPSGKREAISPQIGLYFTDEAPTRSSYTLQMRNFDIDIPAGESSYAFEETMRVSVESDIVGLYPHAHYIGKDLSAYAIFPDGSKHWLFRISDWDFNWQSDYRYESPLRIPAGTTLHMKYVYDNSLENPRNPHNPPRRVRGGWKSTDEMGELTIQAIPVRSEDLAALKQDQLNYNIDAAGGQALYAYELGYYFELQGMLKEAGEFYRDAIEEDPYLASAHFKLGHVYERLGNYRAAEAAYRQALAIQPQLIPANIGMARIHYLNRMDFLAIDALEKTLEWEPESVEGRVYLARIYQDASKIDSALEALSPGMEFHESNPYFRLELGKLLLLAENRDAAIEHLEFAANGKPEAGTFSNLQELRSIQSEAFATLASIEADKGDGESAQRYFELAIEAMPMNVSATLSSAKLYFDEGELEASRARLESIRSLPSNVKASLPVLMRTSETEADWSAFVSDVLE